MAAPSPRCPQVLQDAAASGRPLSSSFSSLCPVRPFLLGFHSVPRIPLMTNVPFPLALIPNPSSSSVPSRRSPVPMPRGCRSPTYNSIKVPSLPPSAFLPLARSPSGRCPPSQLAAGNARPAAQLSVRFPSPLSYPPGSFQSCPQGSQEPSLGTPLIVTPSPALPRPEKDGAATGVDAVCTYHPHPPDARLDRERLYRELSRLTRGVTRLGPYTLDQDSLCISGEGLPFLAFQQAAHPPRPHPPSLILSSSPCAGYTHPAQATTLSSECAGAPEVSTVLGVPALRMEEAGGPPPPFCIPVLLLAL